MAVSLGISTAGSTAMPAGSSPAAAALSYAAAVSCRTCALALSIIFMRPSPLLSKSAPGAGRTRAPACPAAVYSASVMCPRPSVAGATIPLCLHVQRQRSAVAAGDLRDRLPLRVQQQTVAAVLGLGDDHGPALLRLQPYLRGHRAVRPRSAPCSAADSRTPFYPACRCPGRSALIIHAAGGSLRLRANTCPCPYQYLSMSTRSTALSSGRRRNWPASTPKSCG